MASFLSNCALGIIESGILFPAITPGAYKYHQLADRDHDLPTKDEPQHSHPDGASGMFILSTKDIAVLAMSC